MPKEKATRKTKAKAVADGGKKKKGELSCYLNSLLLNYSRLTYHPDPNAPKRGLSAYMFFANEQRDNVREENPGISFGTITSHLPTTNIANHLFRFRSSRQGPWREMEGPQREAARAIRGQGQNGQAALRG